MNWERILEISPAFDKRSKDPKKNCGIHGCDMLFVLKGDEGAVQFLLFTNWHLPNVQKTLNKQAHPLINDILFKPLPADVGYHSPIPLFEGHKGRESCPYVNGTCYYDGSALAAERVYRILLEKGSDGVWAYLEKYYKSTFLQLPK